MNGDGGLVKVLALLADSYSGPGGIAQYVRDFLDGMLSYSDGLVVHSVLRRRYSGPDVPPARISERAAPHPVMYASRAAAAARRMKPDLILCGHANLLPVAALCKRISPAPLCVLAYGVDVWTPVPRTNRRHWSRVDECVSISRFTRERLLSWAAVRPWNAHVLPNCVDASRFAAGGTREEYRELLGLNGRRVLLTVGRITSIERGKGHDKIIALLPRLLERFPDLLYLICGDGDDIPRLQALARDTGAGGAVRFESGVDHAELVRFYHAADAFAMPSVQEGFGFVFLEALACGLPVLAGDKDGSVDALMDGRLGVLADPDAPEELLNGLVSVLRSPRSVPDDLSRFSKELFTERLHELMRKLLSR